MEKHGGRDLLIFAAQNSNLKFCGWAFLKTNKIQNVLKYFAQKYWNRKSGIKIPFPERQRFSTRELSLVV